MIARICVEYVVVGLDNTIYWLTIFSIQEIPYDIEHRLIDWKELRDGSLRIEQHFLTNKLGQLKILVGKRGSKIG